MITAIAIAIVGVVSLLVGVALGAANERDNVVCFLADVRCALTNAARASGNSDVELARVLALTMRSSADTLDEAAKRIATGSHVGAARAARKAMRDGGA